AGHLGMAGYKVNLYNRSEERLEPVRLMGGIELSGVIEGFGPVELATSDLAAAIRDAESLMVVVPANGHAFIAEQAAPYLRDGQYILLNPGRTGGALEFRAILRRVGCKAKVILGEA